MPSPLVVGFDLDMTLVDSRPGIRRVWEELSTATGVRVDAELAASRLGPPLHVELANWVEPDRIAEFADVYRTLYPVHAIEPTGVLPGVHDALAAVRDLGGRTMVVTAKHGPSAQMHVDHLALPVDVLVGDLWGSGKGQALLEHGASVYVGDHVHDVAGARAAGALSVAVTTGPCTAEELAAAGADVVLSDLSEFGPWLRDHVLTTRLTGLLSALADVDGLVVAFSGGADSAFLLAAAVRALGPDRVVAATAVSSSLAEAELAPAREFAASVGVRHLSPETHEMLRQGYRANSGDRCYFCKSELLDVLAPIAAQLGFAAVATGTNADDAVAGFRPGMRAAAERGALTPLRDAGLTKAEIRQASRRWGLPTWDKPAAACLSSRIAYGIEVTPARLARVERAEVGLRALFASSAIPVRDLRVRDLGDCGRVELDLGVATRVRADPRLLAAVEEVVESAGFAQVVVDEKGFRSGSMNELLADQARYR